MVRRKVEARVAELSLKPKVGHHGRDHGIALEVAAALQAERDQRHELIAVDHLPLLIDNDQAIGVAIEREADVRAVLATVSEQLRVRRAAAVVDVRPLGETPSGMTSAPSSHSAAGAT